MSIILTIYVTFAHFININVNHPNWVNVTYIDRVIDISFYNVTHIVRMIDISFYNVAYIVRMIDIRGNVAYIVRMIDISFYNLFIYVTFALFIKTNVNHPNYIYDISPFC
jgi:hypothetical protein